ALVKKVGLKNTEVVLTGVTPGGEYKVARDPEARYGDDNNYYGQTQWGGGGYAQPQWGGGYYGRQNGNPYYTESQGYYRTDSQGTYGRPPGEFKNRVCWMGDTLFARSGRARFERALHSK